MDALKDRLLREARDQGFSAARICRPEAVPEVAERLAGFLEAGYHGQMSWLAERSHWRGDPAALWPEARSVIMLAENYGPAHDPLAVLEQSDRAAISVYAQHRDYHDVVKKRLKRLAGRRWTTDGALIVFVQDTRSQARNRELAEERLAEMIRKALVAPKRRVPTKVSANQKRKRVDAKKKRGEVKALRGKVR